MRERETSTQRASDWPADITFKVSLIESPICESSARFEIRCRRIRDIVDRPASRVISEQRPLRPLENFNMLDVETDAGRLDRERDWSLV